MTKTSKLSFLRKSSILSDDILLGGDLNCPLTEVDKVGGHTP